MSKDKMLKDKMSKYKMLKDEMSKKLQGWGAYSRF
jgi:hypothetical protein